MSDVMIDLETLSTCANSVILTIGAIKFDRNVNFDSKKDYKSLPKGDVFYRRVTVKSCTDLGMDISESTQNWWDSQDEEVRNEAFCKDDRVDIKTALKELSEWFRCNARVWGNGSSFDITILEEAYRRCGEKPPWKFWNVRDLRTLYDIGGVRSSDVPNVGKHHALHDCYSQILGVQMAVKNLLV